MISQKVPTLSNNLPEGIKYHVQQMPVGMENLWTALRGLPLLQTEGQTFAKTFSNKNF
jgi:hypothetical protein